ncbi:universal stress protein [Kitasatospora purpeofusca]|uniref:universal stress protein n=1 Tax=Kitasatospora purpeofusca TaxID=67352 RepID=UPI00224EA9F1|nr:universal stress protein [Kitasatospora purpeofusca]MCX4759038.1 universal stress protein [Kitasatospora purpeofusca]WSR30544.1 universal stress protein [Kitasatospora purpeofusca]WSR38785.1 universal stress protein [Kitasatospora purpeofusca]
MTSADERRPIVFDVDAPEPGPEPVALAWAADAADRRGLPLRLLHAAPPVIHDLRGFEEETAVRTLHRLLAESTAGRSMAFPDLELTREVIRGHPVEELAMASEHTLAVVVGRRGRGGFTGMRIGSLPHGLLHRAHCLVVTVPRFPS